MAETKKRNSAKGIIGGIAIVLILLFAGYSFFWFQVAEAAKASYVDELSKLANGAEISAPEVSGYPGKMVISKDIEQITSDSGTLEIKDLRAESWPLPNAVIAIKTGALRLRSSTWLEGLSFDSFDALMRVNGDRVLFDDSALRQRDFEAKVTGSVDISDPDVAIPDLVVTLSNHQDFLSVLVDSGIIEQQAAAFVGFGLSAFVKKETGNIEVPIFARNGMINLGPLPIIQLPKPSKLPEETSQLPQRPKPKVTENFEQTP